jgi:hypothetical protein
MKTKTGFISNSSVSSFIVIGCKLNGAAEIEAAEQIMDTAGWKKNKYGAYLTIRKLSKVEAIFGRLFKGDNIMDIKQRDPENFC